MKHHIFVSYSSKDAKIAFHLVDYLESQGIPCWIAPRNIASGHDYTDSIDEAIKSCDGFILIFSSHSAKSIWIKKELALGISHQKNIFPFKISDIEIDGGINLMLNNLQWITATDHPTEKFPQLVEGLRRYDPSIGSPTPAEAMPPSRRTNKKWIFIAIVSVLIVISLLLVLHPWNKNNIVNEQVTNSTVVPTDTTHTPTLESVVAVPTETAQPSTIQRDQKEKAEKQKVQKEKAEQKRLAQEKAEKERIEKEKAEKAAAEKAAAEKVKEEQDKTAQTKANSNSATMKKYDKAVSLFNARRYKDALTLFEELKSEGSTASGLDTYIKSCKEKTK